MNVSNLTGAAPGAAAMPTRDAFADVRGEDFLRLLIQQITNQDPLEPTSNEDLLKQMASIRDIEVNTRLSGSLQRLTDEQRFGATASLIGRYVTSAPDESGATVGGFVTGVRYEDGGQAVLRLDSGAELPVDRIAGVQSASGAAGNLVGKIVLAVSRGDPDNPQQVEGEVTGVHTSAADEVMLDLDTGDQVRFADVIGVRSAA